MIGSMILQEIISVSRLSVPLAILYLLFPNRLFSFLGIALCALAMGTYVAYATYKTTKNMADGLKHVPSDQHMQSFHHEITQCGLQPEDVCLRYAYADDGIAITMLNTVAIDPMLWKGITDDPEFTKAKGIIETHLIPGIPETKKVLHAKLNETLSPNAQKFIFRHELGHVFHNYSKKRVLLTGVIGGITTLAGLLSASAAITPLGGIGAVLIGILVGSATDLSLTYSSNLFFKAREEKKADMFAMRYSSKEEIYAAADFFEQYEQCAQEYRKNTGGLMNSMPTTLLTGHPDGITRSNYLRNDTQA